MSGDPKVEEYDDESSMGYIEDGIIGDAMDIESLLEDKDYHKAKEELDDMIEKLQGIRKFLESKE